MSTFPDFLQCEFSRRVWYCPSFVLLSTLCAPNTPLKPTPTKDHPTDKNDTTPNSGTPMPPKWLMEISIAEVGLAFLTDSWIGIAHRPGIWFHPKQMQRPGFVSRTGQLLKSRWQNSEKVTFWWQHVSTAFLRNISATIRSSACYLKSRVADKQHWEFTIIALWQPLVVRQLHRKKLSHIGLPVPLMFSWASLVRVCRPLLSVCILFTYRQ